MYLLIYIVLYNCQNICQSTTCFISYGITYSDFLNNFFLIPAALHFGFHGFRLGLGPLANFENAIVILTGHVNILFCFAYSTIADKNNKC